MNSRTIKREAKTRDISLRLLLVDKNPHAARMTGTPPDRALRSTPANS
jgi:hypothetical protein